MTNLEALHFVNDTHAAMLQCARLDKPSGFYPAWVEPVSQILTDTAREYLYAARQDERNKP